jgi:hypothetical protein
MQSAPDNHKDKKSNDQYSPADKNNFIVPYKDPNKETIHLPGQSDSNSNNSAGGKSHDPPLSTTNNLYNIKKGVKFKLNDTENQLISCKNFKEKFTSFINLVNSQEIVDICEEDSEIVSMDSMRARKLLLCPERALKHSITPAEFSFSLEKCLSIVYPKNDRLIEISLHNPFNKWFEFQKKTRNKTLKDSAGWHKHLILPAKGSNRRGMVAPYIYTLDPRGIDPCVKTKYC